MQINVTCSTIEELLNFAQAVVGTREVQAPIACRGIQPDAPAEGPVQAPQTDTAPATAETEDRDAAPAAEGTEPESYTLVDVRAALGALNKAGKKAQVQELIKSFGVDRLSRIPEGRLPEVMEKAGEL